MDNSFFVYSNQLLAIERFHICSWEFVNGSALLEIGCEISSENLPPGVNNLDLSIYIPWLNTLNLITDLYPRLKDAINSKFIFNDAVANTHTFDGGTGTLGVMHEFQGRAPLSILPVSLTANYQNHIIQVQLDLSAYHNKGVSSNIYFRISITSSTNALSIRKKGVSRTTIIYDYKINEGRNISDTLSTELRNKELCSIKHCFCFTIVPNSYDLSFYDSSSLKNVRTLEYDAFYRYLNDHRVQKDELMVVFSKKTYPNSFAFFSIFVKERIGTGQFALAILINLISGILLFLPAFRKENNGDINWHELPIEVFVAIFASLSLFTYLIWPEIDSTYYRIKTVMKGKTK
jgi:hypothetical protein